MVFVSKIKNIFNTEDKKRLLSNFISLSVLQGANYILPLITLPYLVRVLGPEKFGLIAFAQAFIQYFNILTDYGFNLSATREISIHRENKEKVSEIFSSVMVIKMTLIIVSVIIVSIIVFSFEKFRNDWEIYYLTFGMVIGQVLFPVWFFQGMERMKYITFLNITAKLIFTISIFIFIHKASDYIYVPLINSLGFIVAGILALWIVFRDFGVKFKLPNLSDIKYQLKEGWHIFITSIQSNILSSSGVFVLGLFANHETVGYYSAVERLLKALVSLFQPVTQSIYPYSSKQLSISIDKGINFIKKVGTLTTLIAVSIATLITFFSKWILNIVYGPNYENYSIIMQFLSIWLVAGVLNNFIGIQFLTGSGNYKIYLKSFTIASLITLCLFFVLTWKFSYYGIITGMISGELALTFLMIYFIRKYGVLTK